MYHSTVEHYGIMFVIMVVSGFLTTMNVWADKLDDVRFSINDLYMTLTMTGWMFLFMGLWYKESTPVLVGLLLVAVNLWCIRTQFMVTPMQYAQGMIPHHSMAVHMSRKLLQRGQLNDADRDFVANIVSTQEKEIDYMKRRFA